MESSDITEKKTEKELSPREARKQCLGLGFLLGLMAVTLGFLFVIMIVKDRGELIAVALPMIVLAIPTAKRFGELRKIAAQAPHDFGG